MNLETWKQDKEKQDSKREHDKIYLDNKFEVDISVYL